MTFPDCKEICASFEVEGEGAGLKNGKMIETGKFETGVSANPFVGWHVDPVGSAGRQIARYQRAREIGNEVSGQHKGRDNLGDAMRHAEWNRRMVEEVGPLTAWSAGIANEAGRARLGLVKGEPIDWAAIKMDLHNNAVGREAGAAGTSVDKNKLRKSPGDNRPEVQRKYPNKNY